MRNVVIAIHGLGNKPPRRLLERWWKNALREGLVKSGTGVRLPLFRLVYWSDIIYRKPLHPGIRNEQNPLFLRERYTMSRGIPHGGRSSIRGRLFRTIEYGMEKAFRNERIARRIDTAANHFLRRFFADLDTYNLNEKMSLIRPDQTARDAIQDRLFRILKKYRKRRILLIAHSMGSIVAYDVLSRHPRAVTVETLVTIGSPLGLPNIKNKLFSDSKLPAQVKGKPRAPESIRGHWYNLADPEDKVAMDSTLNDDFDSNSENIRIIDEKVFNDYESHGRKNPHKSYGYLRTPQMARIITEFLRKS